MIPDIHSIVEMLIAGQCTAQQAISWINTHMENADLRDHFAGLAMPVVASGYYESGRDYLDVRHFEAAADGAYQLADALLKARQA